MADYIEREALYEKAYWHGELPDVGNPDAEGVEAVDVCDIDSLPAADVAPVRHGRWERVIPSKSAAKWSSKVSCSVCHSAGYKRFNYCPNCGAKMDGERKEEKNGNEH